MSHISSKTVDWVENGIITHEQGRAIVDYEANRNNRNWVIWGICTIGVIAIITGLISLVAANWESIPDSIKLFVYFLIQFLLGVAFVLRYNTSGSLREVFLLTFILMFFAGIGLIAQIFNLEGNGWEALFFWLIITLPATLLAQTRLASLIWFAVLCIAIPLCVDRLLDQSNSLIMSFGIV